MSAAFVPRAPEPGSAPGIGSWLAARARLDPDREAVVDGPRRLSYRELDRRVDRAARALVGLGLEPGDRFAVLSPNRLEAVELLMAAARAGLIAVPLNLRLAPAELAFMLEDSGARALVLDPALAELALSASAARRELPLVALGPEPVAGALAYEELLGAAPAGRALPDEPGLGSPHVIIYTAGTTGRPKGAVLSQAASFWNAVNLELALGLGSADRDLLLLPLFHVGGIGLFTLPMLHVGGTVVLERGFEPARALRTIGEERITRLFGVPAMFQRLADEPGFGPRAWEGVRTVMSGGAPLPPSLIERYFREAGVRLLQGFGMSEAAPSIATLRPELALAKAGSVGRPLAHLEALVVDSELRELPRGEVGELVVRGPSLMQGYWNRAHATAEAFVGGYFHTGDLARMDEDGDLWIVDRKKDMFISGGENVYPAEVEHGIHAIPAVLEAAVVGVPDERWGEVGRAVVALRPGASLSAEELRAELGRSLARYKVPKHVLFVEALPRNAAGKVLKGELR